MHINIAVRRGNALLLGITLLVIGACSGDNTDPPAQGTIRFEMTDSPIDEPEVEAVFVTVAGISLDGQAISGVDRQTIAISDLTDGRTVELATADLPADTYTTLNVILDLEADASGNSPGCFVRTLGGIKHPLGTNDLSASELFLTKQRDFEVIAGSTQQVVIDLDLRKSIRLEDNPTKTDRFDFVSQAEMVSAFRIVGENAGSGIRGSAAYDGLNAANTVVVYAYNKGEFSQGETTPSGSGQVRFRGAITSSKVNGSGAFSLAFLSPGSYELIIAAFRDENQDGSLEYQGRVEVALTNGGTIDLSDVEVQVDQTLNLDFRLIGLL